MNKRVFFVKMRGICVLQVACDNNVVKLLWKFYVTPAVYSHSSHKTLACTCLHIFKIMVLSFSLLNRLEIMMALTSFNSAPRSKYDFLQYINWQPLEWFEVHSELIWSNSLISTKNFNDTSFIVKRFGVFCLTMSW